MAPPPRLSRSREGEEEEEEGSGDQEDDRGLERPPPLVDHPRLHPVHAGLSGEGLPFLHRRRSDFYRCSLLIPS